MNAALQTVGPLVQYLLQRIGFMSTVDKYRMNHLQRPAKKRQIEQLAFDHLYMRSDQGWDKKRFPGALVFTQQHIAAAIGGNIFPSFHPPFNPADQPCRPDHNVAVKYHDEIVTRLQRQENANDKAGNKPGKGEHGQPAIKNKAAQLSQP